MKTEPHKPEIDSELRLKQWRRSESLWAAWAKRETPPPVLLLTGTPGMGKRTLARRIVQWIQCERGPWSIQTSPETADEGFGFFGAPAPAASESDVQMEPCDDCVSCRQHLSGNAIDCLEVVPDDSGTFKVDQFRELKSKLGHGAYAHRFRAVLIPDAERMTTQAANSLLKLLEEPPRGWIFVLTSSDRSLLLPTIVSRCQFVRLGALADADIQAHLVRQGVPPEAAKIASVRAHGSISRAADLVQPSFEELRAAVTQFLLDPARGTNAVIEWAADADHSLDSVWDEFEAQLHQRIVSVPLTQTAHWIAHSETLAEARRLSLTPVNKKLLLQDWLAQWLSTSARGLH